MKRTRVGAAAGAALGLAATMAARHAWRGSLPQVAGSVAMAGLSGRVTIDRDRWGVPHVRALTIMDAALAMGFLHGQDRLFQLDLGRRVAGGRLAEIAGEAGLASDRLVRRVGLRRWAERDVAALDPEARAVLEAYAGGINAAMAQRPLPIEFRILRTRPEPWTIGDTLLAARLLDLSLALNWDIEVQRLQLLQAIGPERAARLDLVYPERNPTILRDSVGVSAPAQLEAATALYREAAQWFPAHLAGSNSWVVDGTRTASGRPLLCNDPHLAPLVPSVWYEAHIAVSGDFESAGVTMPGLPLTVIGHNRRIAWGYTNSFADVQDLVVEEFDDLEGTNHRTETGWQPSLRHTETIAVKGGHALIEEVVETRHGCVVVPPSRLPGGEIRGLALQWTSNRPSHGMRWLIDVQRARDWDGFRAAHQHMLGPSLNAIYADVDGHIGYLLTGQVPVRRTPSAGLPRAGWSGEALWERTLEADEMPQVLDPADHHLVTANNRVVGRDFPHHISDDYMNGYRALRIEEMLREAGDRLDVAAMQAMQVDVVCPPARQLQGLLAQVHTGDGAAQRLRSALLAWDARATPEAEEPAMYECVVRRLMQYALEPLCGEHWAILAGTSSTHPVFDYPGNIIGRLLPNLLERWQRGDAAMLEGTSWPEVGRRALEQGAADFAMLDQPVRWGRLHALTLQHPLVRGVPALGRVLNAGTVDLGGNSDTVMASCHSPAAPFHTVLWTPSWRQVLDLADWDGCTGVHLPGQSGQPSSEHYRDLVQPWLWNRQHQLCWSDAAVADAAASHLTLRPEGG